MRRRAAARTLDARAELRGELERRLEGRAHAGLDAASPVSSARHADAAPRRDPSRAGSSIAPGSSTEVESQRVAPPTMCESSSAASVTSRVSGPAWSSDEAKAIIP